MKRFAIATLITFLGVGSASAEYSSEIEDYIITSTHSQDMTSLPATAAGSLPGSDSHEDPYIYRDNQQR